MLFVLAGRILRGPLKWIEIPPIGVAVLVLNWINLTVKCK